MSAARELIEREGIAGFSLRDLARRLGVSHAAAYRHFASKDELVARLVWDVQLRFTACLKHARDAAGADPRARLSALARAYVRFGLEGGADLELAFSREVQSVGAWALEHGLIVPADLAAVDSFGVLLDVTAEAVAAGVLPAGTDPMAASLLLWSSVHGYCLLARDGAIAGLCGQRGRSEDWARAAVLDVLDRLISRDGPAAPTAAAAATTPAAPPGAEA
jgi:AcrR family transcriptional regulator